MVAYSIKSCSHVWLTEKYRLMSSSVLDFNTILKSPMLKKSSETYEDLACRSKDNGRNEL